MPEFNFNNAEREAVVTFVLGLVAEPPAEQFVYTPNARQEAIIQGRHVLERYNCAGCHMLEAEQWELAFAPGTFDPNPPDDTYPFMMPHPTDAELETSITPDRQGLLHANLVAMPMLTLQGHPDVLVYSEEYGEYVTPDELPDGPESVDWETADISYTIQLWEPGVVEGQSVPVKGTLLNVTSDVVRRRRPTHGGDLTHLLLPRVIEFIGEDKGSEAYGWLPPPLMGEGSKVQSGWLHDFLLNPYEIRPAVVLRMPRFNMSSEEATALAAYFAAVDNAQYPYETPQQRLPAHLAQSEEAYAVQLAEIEETGTRFGDTMEIITDTSGCVSCHKVGDYTPIGSAIALAPDLSQVYYRLRPEYMRRWIARPDWVLPYTPMPVNIPYKPGIGFTRKVDGVDTQIYHGDSTAQVDALVDLLSNFDRYAQQQTSISPLVQQASEAAAEEEPEPAAEGQDAAASEPAAGGEIDAAAAPLAPLER